MTSRNQSPTGRLDSKLRSRIHSGDMQGESQTKGKNDKNSKREKKKSLPKVRHC